MSAGELLVEPFRAPYMQRALAELLLLAVLAGAVGVQVVLRRLAFVGDALTHAVFPGIVAAFLLGAPVVLGALVAGLAAAALLALLAQRRRVGADAALAILLTSFFAVGVVLVSRTRTYTEDLSAFLFGRVLTVDERQLAETALVALVALGGLVALRKELLLRAFDPEGASALGYPVALLDLAFNVLVALVVVAAARAVGTALVLALLVVPAAGARLVTGRIATMTAVACLLAALAGWLGLAASYQASVRGGLRLPSGATVVTALTAEFLLLLALAAAAGRPWRGRRRR